MSTNEMPTAPLTPIRRRRPWSDPAGWATAAAGALLIGALAVALGGATGAILPLALTGMGVVAGLFALGPDVARATRRHRGVLLAGVGVAVAFPVLVLAALVLGTEGAYTGFAELLFELAVIVVRLAPSLLVIAAAVGGLVLLADYLRSGLKPTARTGTPWQRLSGRLLPAREATGVASVWRALAGLGLIAFAALAGMVLAGVYLGAGAVLPLVALMAVGAGALAVLATPLLIATLVRADRGNAEAAREDERQRMAAHLHDSVLQTLALVQRQAYDPAAVARLARRQEHELRAWMAGEAELGSETLGAAIRDAVAEVEDEHGAVVEVTILGDRPLDRQGEALAAAAREALRNAARHAPGAPIFVFAEAGPDGAEAFVRDEGGGFDPAGVPTERRGVRDAIVGRMAAAGGTASVESVPGEGTEIVLRTGSPESRS